MEEYEQVLSSFPFESDDDDINYPYSFPFSSMVPKVYQQVKEFIYACLKFSEDLNLRYNSGNYSNYGVTNSIFFISLISITFNIFITFKIIIFSFFFRSFKKDFYK